MHLNHSGVGIEYRPELVMALLILLLIPNPSSGQPDQPRNTKTVTITATAYCLPGKMANGQKTHAGVIALSRSLERDLNVKFGDIIIIEGVGEFVFKDRMPPRWKHYRVDIYYPTLRQCWVFGVKICKLYAKAKQLE